MELLETPMNCFQSPANGTITVRAGPFSEWERFFFCIEAETLLQMSPYFKKQVFRMAHAVCFTRLEYALGFVCFCNPRVLGYI